jgi:hypothetical protein
MSMLKNCFGLCAVPDLLSSLLSLVNADEVEEFVARLGLALEAAKNAAGDGASGGLFNAAHHHAQVARLHDHGDTLGLEDLHDGVGDFLGQALLDLKTAGKHLGDSGELGKADDGLVGDIADVHLACEWHEMVFAEREDFNVLDNDHLAVSFSEQSVVNNVFNIDLVALGQEQKRLCVARRCIEKTLSIGILADTFEKSAHGTSHAIQSLNLLLLRLLPALSCSTAGSAETVKVNHRTGRSAGLDNSASLFGNNRSATLLGHGFIAGVSGSFSQAVATLREGIGLCAVYSSYGCLAILSLALLALATLSATGRVVAAGGRARNARCVL